LWGRKLLNGLLGNEERDEENEAFQTPQIRGNPVEE
jgi:hypothetical protein